MKKRRFLLNIIISIAIIFSAFFVGCKERVFKVGDDHLTDGLHVTLTNVESNEIYDKWKAKDGWVFLTVYLTIENKADDKDTRWVFPSHFTVNDTYTIQTYFRASSNWSSGFETLYATSYDFQLTFLCKYSHEDRDLYLIWEQFVLYKTVTKTWLLKF